MKDFAVFEMVSFVLLVILVVIFVQPGISRYNQWSAQAVARFNLQQLYEAEKRFFFKFGSYSSNLLALGWRPTGPLRYHYGFPSKLVPDRPPRGFLGHYEYAAMNTGSDVFSKFLWGSWSKKKGNTLPSLDGAVFGHGVLQKDNVGVAFVAAAVGNLDSDDALDRMVITHEGRLIHLCDDTKTEFDDAANCQHAFFGLKSRE